jgi:uncharacterized protein (DUF1015 family)
LALQAAADPPGGLPTQSEEMEMAVVLPFAALRYNQEKVGGLVQVVTQPYDKITPEMQREYLRRSPYNLAHLVKGETQASDGSVDNVYTRAAAKLRQWQAAGILVRRPAPAYYAYFQRFTVPQPPGSAALTRKGFIALGRLEPYDSGVVFRHEQTLSAPKADRLELLRATRAHLESIMMLYSDPQRRIEAVLDDAARRPATAQVEDEYGVLHQVWEVDDPGSIERIRQIMADQKLIIADGHHRYETALNFERECRATHPGRKADCSSALMTYFNMEGEGIVILPTHRLLAGLPGWNREEFLANAAQYFSLTRWPFGDAGDAQPALANLREAMRAAAAPILGALFENDAAFYCLRARSDIAWDQMLPDLNPAQRSLDVNILHRIALARCLGVDEESVKNERYLSYVRHWEEGVAAVRQRAAQACFFLNPVRIEQVREIALGGRLLPQKSTDFYPKLLSGLVLYPLDH